MSMLLRIVLFGMLLSLLFFQHGLTAGNDLFEKADLAVVNHPDLFKSFWNKPSEKDPEERELVSQPERKQLTPKIEVPRTIRGEPIPLDQLDSSLVQRVFFNYDKAILSSKTRREIQINTTWLKKHPEYDILLEGHCDERGSDEYNIALGDRRAYAVSSYMIELGIDSNRISTRSWGEEKPLDPQKSERAYALNRRVEFYAIPK